MFEIKKIMRRRTTKVAIFFSVIIILYLFGSISMQEKVLDENGKVHSGLDAISMLKDWDAQLEGEMSEARIKTDIKLYQDEFANPNNVRLSSDEKSMFFTNEVYWRFLYPKKDYYILIAENYDEPNSYSRFSKLPNISLEKSFYETRNEKISKILNQEYADGNYQKSEKEYWLKMNENVEVPFVYGYARGWMNLINSVGIWFFTVFIVCVCVAPVFANEYQNGMDSLILTSKNGKKKTVVAKIIASLICGVGIFLMNAMLSIALVLVPYGIDGWNLQVQIFDTIIPYPFNFLQAMFLYLFITFLITLAAIMLCLELSVSMKTPYPVLIIMAFVLILPFFMTYSDTNYIYNHVFALLPTRALEINLSYYTDYKFGTIVIAWPSMIIIVYFLIVLILPPCISYRFNRHQIK